MYMEIFEMCEIDVKNMLYIFSALRFEPQHSGKMGD